MSLPQYDSIAQRRFVTEATLSAHTFDPDQPARAFLSDPALPFSRRRILVGMRRWIVAALVLAIGVGTYLALRPSEGFRAISISYRDIAKVQALPVPEGVSPPPLVPQPTIPAQNPLSSVRRYVPSPFPAPAACREGPRDGLKLEITLRDGRRLVYESCAFPASLEPLYENAWG